MYTATKTITGQISKEVVVLPHKSKSGAFSRSGNSGSAAIDGKSMFAGLLTGGTTVSTFKLEH